VAVDLSDVKKQKVDMSYTCIGNPQRAGFLCFGAHTNFPDVWIKKFKALIFGHLYPASGHFERIEQTLCMGQRMNEL